MPGCGTACTIIAGRRLTISLFCWAYRRILSAGNAVYHFNVAYAVIRATDGAAFATSFRVWRLQTYRHLTLIATTLGISWQTFG